MQGPYQTIVLTVIPVVSAVHYLEVTEMRYNLVSILRIPNQDDVISYENTENYQRKVKKIFTKMTLN